MSFEFVSPEYLGEPAARFYSSYVSVRGKTVIIQTAGAPAKEVRDYFASCRPITERQGWIEMKCRRSHPIFDAFN